MVAVVGNEGADEAAHNQCADPVAAVHAAMAAVVMMMRGRRRMVLPYYNGASVGRSAFVHHRLPFVMGV